MSFFSSSSIQSNLISGVELYFGIDSMKSESLKLEEDKMSSNLNDTYNASSKPKNLSEKNI